MTLKEHSLSKRSPPSSYTRRSQEVLESPHIQRDGTSPSEMLPVLQEQGQYHYLRSRTNVPFVGERYCL